MAPCCPAPACSPPCCPPACCPPIVIKTQTPVQPGQCCVFQLPPVNIVCEIPPPPKIRCPPKVCCIPIVTCEEDCCPCPPCGPCCPSPCGRRC